MVLSRRKDESIVIGDDVHVTIVDIRGDTVRLGITAPKSIPVYRKEIFEAIQRENIEAAQARAEGLDTFKGMFPPAPPAPPAGGGPKPAGPEQKPPDSPDRK